MTRIKMLKRTRDPKNSPSTSSRYRGVATLLLKIYCNLRFLEASNKENSNKGTRST